MNTSRQTLNYLLALTASCLLLLIPALYNHYPLVDPDAGTYIASGFKLETPMDRPITYGLLVRLFSFNGLSLWGVVVAQALILSALIFSIVKAIRPVAYIKNGFITILFLSLYTSLPWLVGMIHPDVFTSIACMCIVLLLLPPAGKWGRVLTWLLFFIAIAVHMSHPILFVGLLACLFFLKKLYALPVAYKRLRLHLIILALLSISGIAVMGSALSKSKHVFFTGTLLEKGVLQTYLNDNCTTKDYKLCAYKDQLPKTSDEFVWLSSSPLYKIGDWQGTKREFSAIDKDIMTTPKYLGLFIMASVKQFGQQATTFNVGTGTFRFPTGSNVNNQVVAYLPHEAELFNMATQNTEDLPAKLHLINLIYTIAVLFSITVLLTFITLRWRQTSSALRTLLVVAITACILNCADFATLSVVVGRYGAKMIWMLPFCALVWVLNLKHETNQ